MFGKRKRSSENKIHFWVNERKFQFTGNRSYWLAGNSCPQRATNLYACARKDRKPGTGYFCSVPQYKSAAQLADSQVCLLTARNFKQKLRSALWQWFDIIHVKTLWKIRLSSIMNVDPLLITDLRCGGSRYWSFDPLFMYFCFCLWICVGFPFIICAWNWYLFFPYRSFHSVTPLV